MTDQELEAKGLQSEPEGLAEELGAQAQAELDRAALTQADQAAQVDLAQAAQTQAPAPGIQDAQEPTLEARNALDGTMPEEEILYDLADLFKTFSDTTRIKILYALMGDGLCVADIAAVVGATQSAVSHQLRILKQARLVRFQRDGKNIIYSLADDHVYTMLAQGLNHICE